MSAGLATGVSRHPKDALRRKIERITMTDRFNRIFKISPAYEHMYISIIISIFIMFIGYPLFFW